MTHYLFYDDETANRQQWICAVGYICMDENRNELFRFSDYIDPEGGFEPIPMSKHHITPEKVAGKKTFKEFCEAEDFPRILSECVLVAHSARSADLAHIRKSFEHYEIDLPEIHYIDTCEMANTLGEAESGELPDVCKCYGVVLENHHDAFEDAVACAGVFWAMSEKLGEIPEAQTYVPGDSSGRKRRPRRKRPNGTLGLVNASEQTIEELLDEFEALGLLADIDEIIELGPCAMKFSGVANGMSSDEIEAALQNLGYGSGRNKTVTGNPGKRTSFFAVGDNVGASKIRAAKSNGVRVIALADFLDALAE